MQSFFTRLAVALTVCAGVSASAQPMDRTEPVPSSRLTWNGSSINLTGPSPWRAG